VGTTVLIVDDHPTFRATARMLLEAEGYEVIGEAPDGTTAIMEARRQVAERITAHNGAPAVVLTSSRDSSDFGPLVSGSGARGFISKGDLSGAAIAELL
jgi:Zn-dependent M28 family amino/carboxypeptidase